MFLLSWFMGLLEWLFLKICRVSDRKNQQPLDISFYNPETEYYDRRLWRYQTATGKEEQRQDLYHLPLVPRTCGMCLRSRHPPDFRFPDSPGDFKGSFNGGFKDAREREWVRCQECFSLLSKDSNFASQLQLERCKLVSTNCCLLPHIHT